MSAPEGSNPPPSEQPQSERGGFLSRRGLIKRGAEVAGAALAGGVVVGAVVEGASGAENAYGGKINEVRSHFLDSGIRTLKATFENAAQESARYPSEGN